MTNITTYLQIYFKSYLLANFFEFDRTGTLTSFNFTKLYIKNFTAPGLTPAYSSEIFSLTINYTIYFRYISIEDSFIRSITIKEYF